MVPGEPINCTRLKMELSQLHDRKAYFWDADKNDYTIVNYEEPAPDTPQSINLPLATGPADADKPRIWYPDPVAKAKFLTTNGLPTFSFSKLNQTGGDGLVISGLDINPLAYDYVNLLISMPKAQTATGLYVAFDDNEDPKAPFKGEPQVSKILQVNNVENGALLSDTQLHIKVSHFGQWYAYRKIRRMKLSFSNIDAVSVSKISISDDRRLLPQLFVMNAMPKTSGEYFCGKEPFKFVVDAGEVAGAKTALVEISKVNQSWDTFLTEGAHGKDKVVNQSYSVVLKGGKAFFMLDPQTYAGNGFYDVRAALVNDKNELISDWSDLVTLYRPDLKGRGRYILPGLLGPSWV